MLRVEGLTIGAGDPPLSFEIANGQTIGLLGSDANQLLRIVEAVGGLRVPLAGNIRIDDLDVVRDSARARPIVSICLPRATHRETSLREHAGVVAASRSSRISAGDGIKRLGLNPKMRLTTPAAKSAAALLAALLPNVPVVLLHEPFRNLDAGTRATAIAWIRELGASGASVLVASTEEGDVRAVSHSVIGAGATR